MPRANWLRWHGFRLGLAAFFVVAVPTAVIGAADAITPTSGAISSSAESGPDGVQIVTLTAEGTPAFEMYCNQARADYDVQPGALNADGLMNIGTVRNTSWSGCSAPLGAELNITLTDVWQISAMTPLTGGVGTTRLDEVAIAAENPDGLCSLSVRGSINAELDLNEKTLTADRDSADLTIADVQGCYGLVTDGDKATFEGEFNLP